MKAARADIKKRVVIPGARPGDLFDIQRQGDERFVLVRLHRAGEAPEMSREACLEAMDRSPLSMTPLVGAATTDHPRAMMLLDTNVLALRGGEGSLYRDWARGDDRAGGLHRRGCDQCGLSRRDLRRRD